MMDLYVMIWDLYIYVLSDLEFDFDFGIYIKFVLLKNDLFKMWVLKYEELKLRNVELFLVLKFFNEIKRSVLF